MEPLGAYVARIRAGRLPPEVESERLLRLLFRVVSRAAEMMGGRWPAPWPDVLAASVAASSLDDVAAVQMPAQAPAGDPRAQLAGLACHILSGGEALSSEVLDARYPGFSDLTALLHAPDLISPQQLLGHHLLRLGGAPADLLRQACAFSECLSVLEHGTRKLARLNEPRDARLGDLLRQGQALLAMIAERVPRAVEAGWKDSLPRRFVALLEAAAAEAGEAPYDPHSTGALLRSLRAALHHRTLVALYCDDGSGDGEEASLVGPDGLVSEVALYGLYQRRFPQIFYAVSVAAARGGIELWRWPSQYRQCSDALDQALRAPGLNNADIARYGRQLLLPELGRAGQEKLKRAGVLVVGAGGLGYLATAGFGRIGIVDNDVVDESNLHRQVLHSDDAIGQPKAWSAARALRRRNPYIQVTPHVMRVERETVLALVEQYDVVVDATDNAPTRYMLNDACVLSGRPLVSGSALRTEGQVTVYNYAHASGGRGPCYRCLFPRPPPPAAVTNCSDGGVLGPVPGIIGALQALEAIKVVVGQPVLAGRLLLVDGVQTAFRSIKTRGSQPSCAVCGPAATITRQTLPDYEDFCGVPACDRAAALALLADHQRITAPELAATLAEDAQRVCLLDVRPAVQFGICQLPGAPVTLNVPFSELTNPRTAEASIAQIRELVAQSCRPDAELLVVCRRGNDSQHVVQQLAALEPPLRVARVRDLRDGLLGWAAHDASFPVY